jgi:hypothetical protein
MQRLCRKILLYFYDAAQVFWDKVSWYIQLIFKHSEEKERERDC